MSTSEDDIRENAGDALNANTQSTVGTKDMPAPDSNTGGVGDAEGSPGGGGGGSVGSVASEQAALHEEAEAAKAAFAGTADVPGAAGIIESEADGAPTGDAGGGSVVDTEAPARAREQAEEDDSKPKGDREPTMGEMLAAELGSEPGMKWESKIVDAMSSDSGAMDEADETK